MPDSYSICPFVQEPDPDLEVVLEKKGNMDEAHIDQVCPRSSPLFRVSCHPPVTLLSPTRQRDSGLRDVRDPSSHQPASGTLLVAGNFWPPPLHAGRPLHYHSFDSGANGSFRILG